jgi:tetratricopeptide (TPR) repeat protein
VPTRSIKIDTAWKKAALVVAAAVIIPATWFVLKWCMANSATYRADTAELAVYLTQLAPDDPRTHYVAAILLEKSFDPNDIEKSLGEFEKAAGLAPANYMFWLDLGRARERSGDAEGAESALRRTLVLAPNYSRVRWALGNNLLRQGRIDEAFTEIDRAVAGDPALANPAAATTWQFFGGDIGEIRRVIHGSSQFDSALAALLAREKRFDEAMEIWNALPADEKRTSLKETGTGILGKLLEAKKFRYATRVSADLGSGADKPGLISNAGFESAVKPDGAGLFEWQIAPGLRPQIVLSTSQKHSGSNSLLLIFNSSRIEDFRSISQTVAVEPGASYELEIFYRSELKTSALFKWEIADAGDGKRIAITEPLAANAEWTPLRVRFKVGEASDGITIRFVREGCGQVCSVSGNLWFDDFALRAQE